MKFFGKTPARMQGLVCRMIDLCISFILPDFPQGRVDN